MHGFLLLRTPRGGADEEIYSWIWPMLEPYNSQTEDPRYIAFEDEEYETA